MIGQKRETPHFENDSLRTAIGYSVAFHLAVVAILVLRVVFFPASSLPIENAIRVDMVSLPEKNKAVPLTPPAAAIKKQVVKTPPTPEIPKPIPKIETPPKALPKMIEAPKPTNKISLKKTQNDQAAALKRLEALSKLEKQSVQRPAASAPAPNIAPTEVVGGLVKGNAISKGASLTGIAKLDNDNYVSTVTEKVKQNWNLPSWLTTAALRAVVKVYIDSQGRILRKQLVLSSKNETFDDRVMAAIDSAAPFPAPPEDLAARLSVYGFELDLSP